MEVLKKTVFTWCLLTAIAFSPLLSSLLYAAHGISIDGKLKYPPDFKKFDYTSDRAKIGGHLVLHSLGGFDKMNPFTMKGEEPYGLDYLVFETLAIASLDEPFAEYGLIAKDIELAADKMSVTFTINRNARFSDGTPITADDVKFSLEMMKSVAAKPQYQFYYNDIKGVEILSRHRIRFNFVRRNRELHMIAAQLPVISKKFFSKQAFDKPSIDTPIGSGPYVVDSFKPGKSITYKRNDSYWGWNLPVRKNMYNYQFITIKYFKDQSVSLEALKAHDFDFMHINVAKHWARDLKGEKFDKKLIVKEKLKHKNNQGMQGFVINLRKPFFKDRRVRQALMLAFNFEWTNESLFHGQYKRSNSYFSNSPLAATGLPTGLELEYLQPFKDELPAEVFTTPIKAPVNNDLNDLRNNLRKAKKLLEEAGWTVKNGQLVNADGTPFTFEILLYSPFFVRVCEPYTKILEKLGIKATMRKVDAALYVRRIKNFEYDMLVYVFGQSLSPGNEQINYWHSTSADRNGSANLIGLKNKVVDALVEKIVYVETQEELEAACKALDRVLWYGYYVVPNWYIDYHRVAYWNKFEKPVIMPVYYSDIQAVMTWWIKDSDTTAKAR